MFDSLEKNVSLKGVGLYIPMIPEPFNSRVDRHWHIGLGEMEARAAPRRGPILTSDTRRSFETPYDGAR